MNLLLFLFLTLLMNLLQTVEISYDSDIDQTIINYSDSDFTFVIIDLELSLYKAYDDLCKELVKVKKVNKKLFNKLIDVENNMVEALKLSEVEISRSFRKLKHLKTSWLGANSHKNHQQHKNLMSCWKLKW
jgi:hypothetical protein